MQHEQYTDDAIGQAMNLPGFIPTDSGPIMRLLFKPSFHPEMCVTIASSQIQIIALQTQLWGQPDFCLLPFNIETIAISE